MEPRSDTPAAGEWPQPSLFMVNNGSVVIPNNTSEPILVSKNEHIGNIQRILTMDMGSQNSVPLSPASQSTDSSPKYKPTKSISSSSFCDSISVDPDNQLNTEEQRAFRKLNEKYV